MSADILRVGLSRRELLATAGLSIAAAALSSACGKRPEQVTEQPPAVVEVQAGTPVERFAKVLGELHNHPALMDKMTRALNSPVLLDNMHHRIFPGQPHGIFLSDNFGRRLSTVVTPRVINELGDSGKSRAAPFEQAGGLAILDDRLPGATIYYGYGSPAVAGALTVVYKDYITDVVLNQTNPHDPYSVKTLPDVPNGYDLTVGVAQGIQDAIGEYPRS